MPRTSCSGDALAASKPPGSFGCPGIGFRNSARCLTLTQTIIKRLRTNTNRFLRPCKAVRFVNGSIRVCGLGCSLEARSQIWSHRRGIRSDGLIRFCVLNGLAQGWTHYFHARGTFAAFTRRDGRGESVRWIGRAPHALMRLLRV